MLDSSSRGMDSDRHEHSLTRYQRNKVYSLEPWLEDTKSTEGPNAEAFAGSNPSRSGTSTNPIAIPLILLGFCQM